MCLIVVGWRVHPDYPLIVAANRDEFHARPSSGISRWADQPQIIGGRDLEAGGTWLAIAESRRFAAVTNVREPGAPKGECSRGELPTRYLLGELPASSYVRSIEAGKFSGFNLLVADEDSLFYVSNRNGQSRELPPGIYGLSNHTLDTPWPKLIQAREAFSSALGKLPDIDSIFDLLADRSIYPDESLPNTGVSMEWERRLSAIFVQSENYGTRASTVVLRHRDGASELHERCFDPDGRVVQSSVIRTSE